MSTDATYKPATSEAVSRTIEALAARNVDAILVESREAALAKLKELVPEGCEVFVSTSETLDTIGYTEYMDGNDRYINLHDQMLAQPDAASQREFRRTTTTADYFVGSVQAIAETGEIVVASGSGSQIGAFAYGARRVVMVAGTQKICPTLAEAEARTRGYTLELHDRWLEGRGSGPAPIGKFLVMEHEPVVGRITMILIPESLGW